MDELSVLVVDDQALLRQSLVTILRLDPSITSVTEASNGQEAVERCATDPVDVVLMDIQMPVMDGIEATRHITSSHPDTRVVVLTAYDHDTYVHDALKAGASGFLLKDTSPPALQEAVHTIHHGQALLSPSSLRSLLDRYTPRAQHDVSAAMLTQRQTEVLALIAQGLSNQEIADHLSISNATLKSHIAALLTRLDARDRAQLVIAAYHMGLAGTDPR